MYDALTTKTTLLLIYRFMIYTSLKITYKLIEEQPPPVVLGNLLDDLKLNTDTNEPLKSDLAINFFPMQQPGTKLFRIENFLFKAIKRIDREKLCKLSEMQSKSKEICNCYGSDENCFIKFIVLQVPYESTMNVHEITVKLVDINDNSPIFIPNSFSFHISEGAEIGTKVSIPKSHDRDNIVQDIVTYSLYPTLQTFTLVNRNNSLFIELKETLDRESIQQYDFKVIAVDKDEGLCNTGTLKLNIFVEDINDCFPEFLDNGTKYISLPESSFLGQVIYVVQATDSDKGKNALIRFAINENGQEEALEHFSLNAVSGEISIKKQLDRELISRFVLIILARDSGSPVKSSSMTINIVITDINDNSPFIKIDPVLFISENKPINSVLTTLTVEDSDEGENAKVFCELYSSEIISPFELTLLFNRLSIYTYSIKTNIIFDREKKNFYNLIVHCQDEGINSLSTDVKVLVLVEDENDFPPQFTNAQNFSSVSLWENNLFINPIFKFQAVDPDIKENGKLNFSIIDNKYPHKFTLNSSNGFLFANGYFDYEDMNRYQLTIKVEDSGKIPLQSTIQFIVNILNENDNPPEVTNLEDNRIHIPENISVNTIIFQLAVIDRDNANKSHSSDVFLINNENKFLIIGLNLITTDSLNREVKDKYQISIMTRDRDKHQLSNIYLVDIIIEDVNDCVPEFIFPSKESAPLEILSDVSVGFTIAQISARDADIGLNSKLTYMLHNYNDFFDLDPISGFLRVRHSLKTIDSNQIILNLSVSDSGDPPFKSVTLAFVNISRNPLLKSISNKFDVFLRRSSFIIAFTVLIAIILLMLIGIICIVKKFVKLAPRQSHNNLLRSNYFYHCDSERDDMNLYSGHLLVIDRNLGTPERTFPNSVQNEAETSTSYHGCMMTTF